MREDSMAINSDVKVEINLSELVAIRAAFLAEEMTEGQVEDLANELRLTLTWDSIFYMVDNAILDYLDRPNPNRPDYGATANDAWLVEIEKNKKQFEMVDLVSPSWTIQVPRRKK
tara:strand:- start:573 stop:917 length:345 start_codon:yes stop_codon:yes gene_type:complete